MTSTALVRRLRHLVATAVVGASLVATTASAHSVLDESSPRNGSTVASAPTVVTLRFNESVSNPRVVLRKVRSTTIQGRTSLQVGGEVVTFRPRSTLSKGEYSATWRVRSADGHYITGVIRFTVRTGR